MAECIGVDGGDRSFDYAYIRGQLLILDLDDTIIATKELAFKKTCLVALGLGLATPDWDDFFLAYKAIPYPDYIRVALKSDLPMEEIMRLYESVHKLTSGYLLLPGVWDLLFKSHEAGVPIGILTNAVSAKVPQKIAGIADLVTDV